MSELGRLEDLPADYLEDLKALNLLPLWPQLRAVMPAHIPTPRTVPVAWSYQALRPLLLRAGELTPVEKAERRVLVLANPGHGLENMKASPAIYLGMQLLLPGEWAPSHRHTPNAVRMVVEGNGAYTTVEGEKCVMERGDLILTPTGLWHEHGHDGDQPVVWLDVLDLPIMYYLEASYHEPGARQNTQPGHAEQRYGAGGLLPTPMFKRSEPDYPLLRYPWARTREALLGLAADQTDAGSIQVTFVNPETGGDTQNILGYYALMLRPGETLTLPARSPATIAHVIEGAVRFEALDESFDLNEADTACGPGYRPITLANLNATQPAFLFLADEAPLHRKLGIYEQRD